MGHLDVSPKAGGRRRRGGGGEREWGAGRGFVVTGGRRVWDGRGARDPMTFLEHLSSPGGGGGQHSVT